jgi:hypothetical protein
MLIGKRFYIQMLFFPGFLGNNTVLNIMKT